MKNKGCSISLISLIFIISAIMAMTGCATAPIDYTRATILSCEKGMYDEAIQNAKKGIALNPADASNWYWMGVTYIKKGNYDEAIQAFNKVVELRPTGDQFQSSYHFLGSAYSIKGNYDEAIRDFNKAIELKPTDSHSLSGRGWAYYYKGDFNLAMKDFNKVIENVKPKDKDKMDAMRGKAFSYLGLRDIDTAVNLLQQAKAASDYDNNHDLSLIYYIMGNKEKAWEFRGGKGALGITVKDYKKGQINGADVDKAMLGGPAEKSGIIAGDVIIKLNKAQVSNTMDLLRMIRVLEPGTMAKIKILREGIEKDVDVKVAFADFLMESDKLIAPIMANRKRDSGVKGLKELAAISHKNSDVDDPPVHSSRINKKAYAIVIGIEQYRQKLPKADFAVNDAHTITNYLMKGNGLS